MDVLCYQLDAPHSPAGEWALLSAREQAEAQQRGALFLQTRSILKRELARRSGHPAAELDIHRNEQGKPFCPQLPQLHFNLSHSGPYLALAFDSQAIGIDIERPRPRRFAAIAPRFMSAEQLAAFIERGCPEEEFYACWCAMEALIKHAGSSVWHAHNYPFSFRQGYIKLHFESPLQLQLSQPFPGCTLALAHF